MIGLPAALELQPAWVYALLAGVMTWAATGLGAAFSSVIRRVGERTFAVLLGAAAGMMLAASFWSLLGPSFELSAEGAWLPVAAGFLVGGVTIHGFDRLLRRLVPRDRDGTVPSRSSRRSTLLIAAMTLHNVPEGLALGVAFGAAILIEAPGPRSAAMASALALTVAIALQNLPEGMVVSAPLRAEGFSRFRAFWYGQLTGIVEPIAAVLGALAVVSMQGLLPFALAFAGGAMIFVVLKELVPACQDSPHHNDVAMAAVMLGFVAMMVIDVAMEPPEPGQSAAVQQVP